MGEECMHLMDPSTCALCTKEATKAEVGIRAKFDGWCDVCGGKITGVSRGYGGDRIVRVRDGWAHAECDAI